MYIGSKVTRPIPEGSGTLAMEPDNPLHKAWLEIMAFIPSKLLNTPQDCIFDGTLCHDIYTVDANPW